MSAAFVILLLLGVYRPGLPIVLDSDSLYLDDLWLSLTQGQGLKNWFLPPAPAFFPDLPLVGLFSRVASLPVRHGIFGLALLLLLSASMAGLARKALALDQSRALALGLAGGVCLCLALMFAPAYQGLLRPGQHGGALLSSLWLFALAPDQRGSAGLVKKLGAFALCAAMTFSDRLFLAWGLVPLALSQAFVWRASGNDEWKGWCAWAVGGLALGEAWAASFAGPGLPLIMAAEPLKGLQPNTTLFSAQLGHLNGLMHEAGPAVFVSLTWLAWKGWRVAGAGGAGASGALSRFVITSAACSVLAGLLLGGSFSSCSYPFFLLPLLMLPFDLPRRWALRLPLTAACLASVFLARSLEPWAWAYPSEAAFLDKALKEDGRLSLGMAHYEQARRLRLLAGSKPVLLPIKAEPGGTVLQTYDWMVDASVFRPLELKKADYILIDGLDPGMVAGAFGRPKRVIKEGAHELWVYR